jgi:hypothetical protein
MLFVLPVQGWRALPVSGLESKRIAFEEPHCHYDDRHIPSLLSRKESKTALGLFSVFRSE